MQLLVVLDECILMEGFRLYVIPELYMFLFQSVICIRYVIMQAGHLCSLSAKRYIDLNYAISE